jgi:peptide deformylase
MATLKIYTYPDEVLKKKAQPVKVVDDDMKKLIDDMAETMYTAPGVGLAANQVGVLKRVVVIDVEYTDGAPHLFAFVNPEIVERSGKCISEEGCLSLPGINEEVERAEKVVVRALDRNGDSFELTAEGFLAAAVQHELDHLDGVVLLDRLSFLKRRMLSRELVKRKQEK